MPKLTKRPPAYSLHKPSGNARLRYQGKDYYLGPYGSRESREVYAQLLAEFSRAEPAPTPLAGGISISDLILRYWGFAQTYYRHPDGKPTGEHLTIRAALKPLRRLFGSTSAAEFRAKQLRLLRDEMVRLGWSRRYLNAQVGRVKRMFSWAVSEDLIPESVTGSLASVKGLLAGRSAAREKPTVQAVADEVVESTLPHLPPMIADIVRVLRLTGARIGEILALTPDRLDRSDPSCWSYSPTRHKGTHRGKPRTIYFGPRAIAILTPYVVASGGGRLFDYTREGIAQAIVRACGRAGQPRWHAHQLRHAAATAIRARFGLEAAQVVLGHSEADTSQIYAAADASKAREAIRHVG